MEKKNKLVEVKLTEDQQLAFDAIAKYNNFVLFSQGANGTYTCIVKATQDVVDDGLRTLAQHSIIREMMTNIVIEAQNEKEK